MPPSKRGKTKVGTHDSGKGAHAFLPLSQGFDEYFTGPMNTFIASHDLKGNEKNTLIFFIGDNGAPLKENAWDGSLNLPLVGEKGMLTDGGIRTPFVAAWPGTFPAGTTYDNPVINLDVAATAVAIAGLPHDEKLDGVNLVPFLVGDQTGHPHAALYWRCRSQAAIRADHWKYIRVGPEERYLFDLNAPEGESELAKNNLLGRSPEVAADLEKRLMEWNARLPPPGLPRPPNTQDEMFYDAHVKITGVKSIKNAKPAPKRTKGGPPKLWSFAE